MPSVTRGSSSCAQDWTKSSLGAAATAVTIAAAACGGGGDSYGGTGPNDGDGGSAAGAVQIDMVSGDEFSPRVDTVSAGDTVTWVNQNSVTHTATADDDSWDTGDVSPDASASVVLSETGDHPYHCIYHGSPGSGMHGTIVVQQ